MEAIELQTAGVVPDTVALIWYQGEQDALQSMSAAYQASLEGLIEDFRLELNAPDMTTVITRIPDKPVRFSAYDWCEVRNAQLYLGKTYRTEWVDTDNLISHGSDQGLTDYALAEENQILCGLFSSAVSY
jgi:hypothetical protein